MIKVPTFTVKGIKVKETNLPKELEAKVNLNLLAQAVYVYEERSHTGLRKAKTRAEVERTTKKLYKQKGTGGARHGSRRAPIFVGGGVALGPRPVRRILKLSGRLKARARAIAYSLKADKKEIVAVAGLSKIEKTGEAADLVKALVKATGAKRFTFVISEKSRQTLRFLRNLPNVRTVAYRDANAFDIYGGGMIVLDADIFEKPKVKSQKAKVQVKPRKVKVK
jgi:large subunit ribosomal protein L4